MNRTVFLSFLLLLAVSCSDSGLERLDCEGYVDLLYRHMPLPDSLVHPRTFWEENTRKTLDVRDRMNWGIPEKEFRHFVLPLRVNNEDLDSFRILYADELCDRVVGMSLYDAVLEINHWCHEHVTYTPTDARTRGPVALMASGKGRCGEESTYTVSALRAAGIPARQVYTPRWAHTDDNHAWVEAWVDGKWYFLGACEPEPKLNMGWFNASVSRAMLLHTRVSGDYRGDEDIIERNPVFTEINVIRGYVPARKSTVTVLDESGAPLSGIEVHYKIFNYREFCTVCRTRTDGNGRTSLNMGHGDMLAWASDGAGKYGFAKVCSDNTDLILNRHIGDVFSEDINIIPPAENPLPVVADDEECKKNSVRLAYEDSLRNASHPFPAGKAVLDAFAGYVSGDYLKEKASKVVLGSLLPKDLDEVSLEVLKDAVSSDCESGQYVLCPRISFEMLYPFREEIRKGLEKTVLSQEDAFDWVNANIRIVPQDRNPQKLRIPPVFVWRSRLSDIPSRKIFFVAVCRSLGFPAKLDPVTGKPQYLKDGAWIDADFDVKTTAAAPRGEVRLICGEEEPEYFKDYTISRISLTGDRLLDFEYAEMPSAGKGISLDEGYYVLTTGRRLPDGSVLAHIETFNVISGQVNEVPVVIRSVEESPLDIIGEIEVPEMTDRPSFVLAVVKKHGEPSIHALRQLDGKDNAVIVSPDDSIYDSVRKMFVERLGADPNGLPYIAVVDSAGNVYYFSQGYNTSLGFFVDRILSK